MRFHHASWLIGAVALGALVACDLMEPKTQSASTTSSVYPDLGQNWDLAKRNAWYWSSQGSRLLPLSWLNALEQPGNDRPFLDKAYVEAFGYLWSDEAGAAPLPIGFAKDVQSDADLTFTKLRWKTGQGDKEPWAGMTCAACHTAQLTYKGKRLRVDGGPTSADFQSFIEALNAALKETLPGDSAGPVNPKFERFASKVLGSGASANDKAMLGAALKSLSTWQEDMAKLNTGDGSMKLRYGFARLDAFGHIYNKAAKLAGGAAATGNPSDAPVSYPFLWNVPQLDKVQWNSIASNEPAKLINGNEFQLNALGRNTGEVIGVFADVKLASGAPVKGYASSVSVANLDSMEVQLGTLKPPKWPDDLFGKPDAQLVAQGRSLFETRCQDCHKHLDRNELKAKIQTTNIRIVPVDGQAAIDTDPWMACNAYAYEAGTGVLQGTPAKFYSGTPMGPSAPLSDILGATVTGTLVHKAVDVAAAGARAFFGVVRPPRVAFNITAASAAKDAQLAMCRHDAPSVAILGYQSRPLTGIWATAPYLHNGSVPTLYDLLLPPAQRPKVFYTGSREFDPDLVGLAQPTDLTGLFKFETENPDGTPKNGNWNSGHDYGNGALSDGQRRALVAYMKTL